MTWVIGTTSMFGHGAMISDVRVTLDGGVSHDLLQKAYALRRAFLGGFAGSVYIGFRLIDSLARFLESTDKGVSWEPPDVARVWASSAKEVFDSSPAAERRLGAMFLLVGVSPTETMGMPQVYRPYVIRFSGPDFRPDLHRKGFGACSIGSGASVAHYKRVLRRFFDVRRMPLALERLPLGGVARMLAEVLGDEIESNPVSSVSRNLHVLACRHGIAVQANNNFTWFESDDRPEVRIQMPPVARSYSEFNSMVQRLNAKAACAVC